MSQKGVIVKAVAATAACTVILAGILFYFVYRYVIARQHQRNKDCSSFLREIAPVVVQEELRGHGGTLKGLIVDENGCDVLYLRKSNSGSFTSCFSKVWFNPITEEEKIVDDREDKPSISSPIHEIPLLHQPCHVNSLEGVEKPGHQIKNTVPKASEMLAFKQPSGDSRHAFLQFPPATLATPLQQTLPPPPPPTPPTPPPSLTPSSPPTLPPPLPPPLVRKAESTPQPPPPPPPPLPSGKFSKPLPQLTPNKTKPGMPPPPPKSVGISSLEKPPARPRGKAYNYGRSEDSIPENSDDQGEIRTKLKPLHWDKVATNVEHSVVWNEINDGSFRFDDELIEALFGYTTPNQKSTEVRNTSKYSRTSSQAPPAQVFILDPRKSQNTAIVLKSLSISRTEILEAVLEGHGLSADVLEKLTRISPTDEETAKLLQFNGNPTRLADAESFLYHILKAIPSAFIRIKAMLFRSCYDPEILQLKETLQMLELSCKGLRTRGIFFKLLEAILKAGNRMNAGTARGNAQGFNLNALRKLSSIKSTDGKTTLLRFVVEQVIRSEGKRCAILGRNKNIGSKDDDQHSDSKETKEERDREFLMLGLPILGGLSTDFSNVKKVATIDYENFINMSSILATRVNDIRQLVIRCGSSERSGFVREMKGFLEECEEELKLVREEQIRVMELVKRTTEYYQAGASREKGTDPFQLFAIVKDFLDMVDQVCNEISRKLQKKDVKSTPSSPPLFPLSCSPRTPVRFQNLQSYFAPENPGRLSSDSEDDF